MKEDICKWQFDMELISKIYKEYLYIYIRILLSNLKKEWNLAICNNMDGSRGYYAKWNKSERDQYHMISLTHGI